MRGEQRKQDEQQMNKKILFSCVHWPLKREYRPSSELVRFDRSSVDVRRRMCLHSIYNKRFLSCFHSGRNFHWANMNAKCSGRCKYTIKRRSVRERERKGDTMSNNKLIFVHKTKQCYKHAAPEHCRCIHSTISKWEHITQCNRFMENSLVYLFIVDEICGHKSK